MQTGWQYGRDNPPPSNYKLKPLGIWESGFFLVITLLLVVWVFRKYK